MYWTEEHDRLMCRENLAVDPFTGTKKGTVQKVAKWKLIADNLLEILEPKFKVDSRAVRDRYQLLAQKLRKLMNLKYSTMSLKSHSTDSPTPLFDVLMASCSGFNTACLYGPCKWTLTG